MVAIVDYGVGNLFSLECSLRAIGQSVTVSGDSGVLEAADRIILPGVGAFGDAADKLRSGELDRVLCRLAGDGKPLLGICLGMQLLFERSYEYGEHAGLGLLPGSIVPLAGAVPSGYKIPHMGWNALEKRGDHPLLREVSDGAHVYFVHSYYAADEDTHGVAEDTIASTDYGIQVTAAVARGNVMGCQFHPEKSGEVGLEILRAFCS